jgi:hypothetical protein
MGLKDIKLIQSLKLFLKRSKLTRILTELIGFSIILFYTFIQRTRQLGI